MVQKLKQCSIQLLVKTVLMSSQNDILYYDTPQILASTQLPAPISNPFFGIKKQDFEELSLQMSTWK